MYAIHVTGNAGQCRRTMRPARNVEFIKAIAVGQRFDDERGFACSGDKLGFLLSMPSLRLMFQFIKIHKTAEVPHCQDEYGASGNPIDTMIAVNKLTVLFQPDRRHGSAKFGMALQFRNGTNQA